LLVKNPSGFQRRPNPCPEKTAFAGAEPGAPLAPLPNFKAPENVPGIHWMRSEQCWKAEPLGRPSWYFLGVVKKPSLWRFWAVLGCGNYRKMLEEKGFLSNDVTH
jgi:hypothetical protein